MMHVANRVLGVLGLFIISYVFLVGTAVASTAVMDCKNIGGQPTAAAPVSKQKIEEYFAKLAKARPHCAVAAMGGNPDPVAIFNMAVILQREGYHIYAIELFEKAAQAHVGPAHTKLGDYYNFGIGGTRIDLNRAVTSYGRAMALGDVSAKTTMAIMFGMGRGVGRNPERMMLLLQQTAGEGYHLSQIKLAEMLLDPGFLPAEQAKKMSLPDPVKAATYLRMAADQGSVEADGKLVSLYEGKGSFSDPAIKLKLLEHAANNGDGKALNMLGYMHERGDGIEYDPLKAASLYIRALETGQLDVNNLRKSQNGYPTRWDRQTALEFQKILRDRGLYQGPLDAIVGFGTLNGARALASNR